MPDAAMPVDGPLAAVDAPLPPPAAASARLSGTRTLFTPRGWIGVAVALAVIAVAVPAFNLAVPAGSPLQEFGLMRDKLDREIDESLRLREVIAFLTRPKARALTKAQRAEIRAFLDNPESSAADLLQKLKPTTSKPATTP